MTEQSTPDPWSDPRPKAVREAERIARFALINDAVAALAEADKDLAKQRWRRFSRLTHTPAEMKAEIEELEYILRLMQTYPDTPERARGITYFEHELSITYQHASRVTRASQVRLGKAEEAAPDFARARLVDMVDLAQTIAGDMAVKSGENWLIHCPFHDEDTPSLTIYPPGLGWFCFGCGKGGDAVAFVAEYFQCGMVEGLRWVENLCDIP